MTWWQWIIAIPLIVIACFVCWIIAVEAFFGMLYTINGEREKLRPPRPFPPTNIDEDGAL